ncbi:hypothetical protein D3C78_694410 [compost metagenome]
MLRGCVYGVGWRSTHLFHFGDLGHAKAAAIEGDRGLLALAAGHGSLFRAGKGLAFAGNAQGLERAKDAVSLSADRYISLHLRSIGLSLIAAIDHIAVRELGANLAPIPVNGRPRQRDIFLLRNRFGREQIPLLPALPPGALAASKLRTGSGLAIIVVTRRGHPVPFVLGIGVTGKDHIFERQGRALPLHRHLQGALVASKGGSPQLTTLHTLIEALTLLTPLDLDSHQLLH